MPSSILALIQALQTRPLQLKKEPYRGLHVRLAGERVPRLIWRLSEQSNKLLLQFRTGNRFRLSKSCCVLFLPRSFMLFRFFAITASFYEPKTGPRFWSRFVSLELQRLGGCCIENSTPTGFATVQTAPGCQLAPTKTSEQNRKPRVS